MYGKPDELTPRQERALAALLTSRSLAAAARQAEVCESTLRRWMKKPVFQAELEQTRRESFSRAVGKLRRVADHAVEVLDSVMQDSTVTPAMRIRAAQLALRYSSPTVGTQGAEELEKRQAKLERARRVIQEADAEER